MLNALYEAVGNGDVQIYKDGKLVDEETFNSDIKTNKKLVNPANANFYIGNGTEKNNKYTMKMLSAGGENNILNRYSFQVKNGTNIENYATQWIDDTGEGLGDVVASTLETPTGYTHYLLPGQTPNPNSNVFVSSFAQDGLYTHIDDYTITYGSNDAFDKYIYGDSGVDKNITFKVHCNKNSPVQYIEEYNPKTGKTQLIGAEIVKDVNGKDMLQPVSTDDNNLVASLYMLSHSLNNK
jgi:hypothetical protein